MKVLFINDYSLPDVYKRCTNGIDHLAHTWGYDYFKQRAEVECADINSKVIAFQKKICTYKFIGDLHQEYQALFNYSNYDVVISANISVISGLSYLKRFVKLPVLVGILHSVPRYKNEIARALLRSRLQGIDKIVCIARKDFEYLTEQLGLSAIQVIHLPWGANLADYDKQLGTIDGQKPFIMSMGKSQRDYPTLIKAFERFSLDNWELKIFPGNSFSVESAALKNIHVIRDWIRFKNAIPILRSANFIVIPLVKSDRTLGITSLYDAMAVGKPVLMTYNPGIDIDVEKEKIGLWMRPYDHHDCAQKMLFLATNPHITQEWGRNARKLLEEKYQYQDFCEKLFKITASSLLTH